MMYIDDKIKDKLLELDYNNMYVVSDFDCTLTRDNSKSSWSILSNSDLVPAQYLIERQQLYDYYRPIEIDCSLEDSVKQNAMNEWYIKHIQLFVKYQFQQNLIKKAAKDLNIMEFRDGAKEFLQFLHEKKVPLIIISAGIGNFIKYFLVSNGCAYDNIYIISNMILFENGFATGVGDSIIHSLNKNEVSLPKFIQDKIENRSQILLLGDQLSDTRMVDEIKRDKTIRVGFLTEDSKQDLDLYKSEFDIVCAEDSSFKELGKILFKIYKKDDKTE